jgi:hypothetical protein
MMVDKETRFDNTIVHPDHVLQYNCTLINIEKNNVDSKAIEKDIEHCS